MSGTIRFDDEHIVKFTLDAENLTITLDIVCDETTFTDTISISLD